MSHEMKLSGGETTVLKALGSAPVPGKMLVDRIQMDEAELVDVLQGLMDADYVLSTKVSVYSVEDIERSVFRVNPSHARELREGLRGGRHREERRRRRRS